MRYTFLTTIALSALLFGCNSSDEDSSNLTSQNSSLANAQQEAQNSQSDTNNEQKADDTAVPSDNHQGEPATDQKGNQPDDSGSSSGNDQNADDQKAQGSDKEKPANDEDKDKTDPMDDKAQPENHAIAPSPEDASCSPINDAKLLFISDLGNYYVPLEMESNDYSLSKESWTKMIDSIEEADAFVQTYKLNDNIKNELASIHYTDNIVNSVYIGFRSVSGHKFNIPQLCEDGSIKFEVIRAPAMDDAVSHSIVFIQLPAQYKDTNIIIENKEVSFEEYETYPFLTEM